MVGIYIGSTTGYSGKNLLAMSLGLKFRSSGFNVGYMKPVGAVPHMDGNRPGDADAAFIQEVLGLEQDPEKVTPVLVTRDFTIKAFTEDLGDLKPAIVESYKELSQGKDVMIIGGSGSFLSSGNYCGVSGPDVAGSLGVKTILVDRYSKELKYDYVLRVQRDLGDDFLGVVFNDVPDHYMDELKSLLIPFLEKKGVKVLGIIPRDPLMGAIKVSDLAERLFGKIISAHAKADRVVENFLIGTMQVENFITHFRRHKNSAVIVGGDRADVQLVALEGNCPCLILTGNLYPNDIILTRSEVLEIPVIVVRDDTYSVAKKMEAIQESYKLRDMIKINHGASLVNSELDYDYIFEKLEL
ncbi:phosphotransacetylase family protein [Desulfovibrio gilichinskyi]|uniref:DRTGG domain-containing protein n=1 Tax=Desulfovibrio gilichinskyi TaxID=1519643 RepID=A0A1X7DH47_9BACT|nr:DRTGG domain-containing protein [Desulfovibrio gilichinskyi]SMF15519.1 hypothetical protein SAMN06295933_1902 [Desulfovibrio gilichinskyi]